MFKPKYDCIARQTISFPNSAFETLVDENFYKKYQIDQNGFPGYTNFGNHQNDEQEKELYNIINPFYHNIIAEFMHSINYQEAKYSWEWWFAIYEPGSKGFTPHSHSTNCKFTISWCHFVKPTDESNFSWYYNKDNVETINETKNEMVFFPGWIWHKVMPNNTKDLRITVAGNINVVESPGYIIET